MKKQNTVAVSKEAKPKNYVAEMEIITQCINKENKYLKISDHYVCNPHTLIVTPDKPLTERPRKPVDASENQETEVDKQFKETLKSTFKDFYEVPNQKYKYPMTTNQQFGWYQNYVSLLDRSQTL